MLWPHGKRFACLTSDLEELRQICCATRFSREAARNGSEQPAWVVQLQACSQSCMGRADPFSLWPLCCCLLCGFVMFTQKPMSSLFLWRPLPQPRILQRSLEWVMWWLPVGRYRLYDTLTGLQQHLWCFLSSVWLEEQRHSVQKRLPREVDFASIFFLWRLPDLIREHPFGTSKKWKNEANPFQIPFDSKHWLQQNENRRRWLYKQVTN